MPSTMLRRALARSAERPPWSRQVWRDTLFLSSAVPLAAPVWLAVTIPTLLGPVVLLALLLTLALTAAQRGRFRALRGVEIPQAPRGGGPRGQLRSPSLWRQLGYHLLVTPLLAFGSLALLYCWGGALVASTVYGWAWLMPRTSPVRGGVGWSVTDGWVTVAGVLLLLALPWAGAWLARLDERLARTLLGPTRAEALARRVEDLAESRAEVVDAADAERRRIERDLHDGAQQRLTSLAMNLGLARRTLKDVPPEAMKVIVEAHEEAQAAITELRDLVRGLHPVVLADRGLDAALSGIAARAPVPVRLEVELPRRLSPTIEAVAYFTVSEALTNVAKHARASRVDLRVRALDGRLRIVITDDGVGGADPAGGTGLTGLRKRAASVDGTLAVHSPLGGPTTITVELPCEL
ncbi:histidine kinase [Kitasatospora sp. NPDC050543]|uniref:sensor histidine kinase n=1 Tax=Kitasatospora sp. NPDC050543 TaxID=3364054 RepID=UPI0037B3C2BC